MGSRSWTVDARWDIGSRTVLISLIGWDLYDSYGWDGDGKERFFWGHFRTPVERGVVKTEDWVGSGRGSPRHTTRCVGR